jgi:ankyrin repeat domain-containing protein 50
VSLRGSERCVAELNQIYSAAVIKNVMKKRWQADEVAVAYFFSEFKDEAKQRAQYLLRSLVMQFSMQYMASHSTLEVPYSRCNNGLLQPSLRDVALSLEKILGKGPQTYIIIDALDEYEERREVFELDKEVQSWKLKNLHLLVTSRQERDIEEKIGPSATAQLCLENIVADGDIHPLIVEELKNDPKWRNWPKFARQEIEQTLVQEADGM